MVIYMIYTVTFNPAIDYIVGVGDLEQGEINRAKFEKVLPGGKGVNVSIVLKNLGIDSVALGFVSGFTGETLEHILNSEYHCNTDFIDVKNGMTRINVKIKGIMETDINGIGPEVSKEHMDELYKKLDKLKEGDILVLAGSISKKFSDTTYEDIMKYIDGRGVKVVVDATKELLLNTLKYKPFMVKPNRHELGETFGVELRNKSDAEIYAVKLKEMGAQNVLVSLGGGGALLIDENNELHDLVAPSGRTKNTVGAGDSMVAGFLAGYLEHGSYDRAGKLGVAAGSASAFSTILATKEEVEELYSKMD